ncbi:MAG: hypothetical protein V1838_01995 [Patescibacteria group bacterium]
MVDMENKWYRHVFVPEIGIFERAVRLILASTIFIIIIDRGMVYAFAKPIWLGVPLILLYISAIVFILLPEICISNPYGAKTKRNGGQ